MIELSHVRSSSWTMACAGDTFNTAVHLHRLGHDVTYLTALGEDPFSVAMIEAWEALGIDTSLVLRSALRRPGLYTVNTDFSGERTFSYWRECSAARDLFRCSGIENALERLRSADVVFLSGVTLAILAVEERSRLQHSCFLARENGALIAFDPNYRHALWDSGQGAWNAMQEFSGCVDIVFPSLADEIEMHGSSIVEDIGERWRSLGIREVIVKMGSQGATIVSGTKMIEVPLCEPRNAVDTTGAGDAFNAGFLSARLAGRSSYQAAMAGHELASETVQHRGALPSAVYL